MEAEKRTLPTAGPEADPPELGLSAEPPERRLPEEPYRGLRWMFIGPGGLRAGWSVLIFLVLANPLGAGLLNLVIYAALFHFHLMSGAGEFAPGPAFISEAGMLVALVIAAIVVALIEGRRLLAYNLAGPRRPQHFLFGLAAGLLALSALVGALAAGGWIRFGPVALSGAAVVRFGLAWGGVFLVGACVEEGIFRCYGLFTLARGINFWWALGIVAAMCGYLAVFIRGSASVGVYAAALLGLFPCLALHQKAAPRSGGFWYAAWVTSALFGFLHISNPNEAGIGIFAAAAIGFVFCVSVRATGSAWWAIGCHAGWDWGETYFYGTADSGLTPHGCLLTGTPAGNPLWSGGEVGPEGSVLVLGVVVLLLVVVLVYGRWTARARSGPVPLAATDEA